MVDGYVNFIWSLQYPDADLLYLKLTQAEYNLKSIYICYNALFHDSWFK